LRAPLAVLAALAFAAGCSPDVKDAFTGYPGGFETPVKTVVAIHRAPAGDDSVALVISDAAPLLAAIDTAITKKLEVEKEKILAEALAEYEQERPQDGSQIKAADCEVLLEDYAVEAENEAATRKSFEGKVTRFRFTLRREKSRIIQDPTRVEALVFCVERSWAPGDTLHFPQIFRAHLQKRLISSIREVAAEQGFKADDTAAARTQ
jgi:hypothetical protein